MAKGSQMRTYVSGSGAAGPLLLRKKGYRNYFCFCVREKGRQTDLNAVPFYLSFLLSISPGRPESHAPVKHQIVGPRVTDDGQHETFLSNMCFIYTHTYIDIDRSNGCGLRVFFWQWHKGNKRYEDWGVLLLVMNEHLSLSTSPFFQGRAKGVKKGGSQLL